MTKTEAIQRLSELYPSSSADTLEILAETAIEFDVTDYLDVAPLMQTLHEWRAVLATLGPEGLTLAGMLSYEWIDYPGIPLCKRIDGVTVDASGETPAVRTADDEPDITGFVPLETPNGLVWLRESGRWAIVEGVVLRVD